MMISALMMAGAVISCQKENSETGQENRGEETCEGITFRAVYDELDTKTLVDEGGKVTWSSGDCISVFDGTGATGWAAGYTKDKKYKNTLESGATAVFKPNSETDVAVEGASKYYALCPRDTGASCDVENGVFDFWLIDCQKGNKDGFSDYRSVEGRHTNYSVAMTTDPANEPLSFKNTVAQLKITVPEFLDGKVTHIAIIPIGGEYIAGDTEVTLNDDGTVEDVVGRYAWKDNGSGSKYSAVYLFPDYNTGDRYTVSGATFSAGTYYAAIRNVELSKGLLIEYRNTAGGTANKALSTDVIASKRTGKSISVKTSHLYRMGSIGDKPASAPSGKGISSIPYSFSFYCNTQKDEDGKYITKGVLSESDVITMGAGAYSGYQYKQYSGVAATEKDENIGASLNISGVTYYKMGSTEKIATPGYNYWAQNQAHDNLNVANMCTRDGIAGLPFECGEFLSVPLQTDLPSSFNISFGLYLGGAWGMKDWAVYYSNDNISWIKAGQTISIKSAGASGKNFMYFQVKADSPVPFKKGGMLYLKVVPVGKASLSSTSCDGFGAASSGNGRIRFHSSITVSPVEVESSSAVSGASIFEGFDGFNGGLDYFIGDRLAGMANFCGNAGTLSNYTLTNVYQRPGYAQIGYVDSQTMASDGDMTTTNKVGSLKTPAIGKAGDLELSFKACVYRSPAARAEAKTNDKIDAYSTDLTTIRVNVIGGGTIDGAATKDIENVAVNDWQPISLTVTGATTDTQIEFTSPSDGTFHRWFIDDICVK